MTEADRGTGRTTDQMKRAPHGATYIWCNEVTLYPNELARHLGRGDLRVVVKSFATGCEGRKLRGLSNLVFDHAFND